MVERRNCSDGQETSLPTRTLDRIDKMNRISAPRNRSIFPKILSILSVLSKYLEDLGGLPSVEYESNLNVSNPVS